jgi:DNA-binding NarL/FixJ family response regulator
MSVRSILVVEDFDQFRQFVVSSLLKRGELEVTEASNGSEALQKAEEQQPNLILLDIGLPDLDGIEVARRARRLAVPPKIVFVSQESSPEIVREALDLGALGYVHKQRAGTDLLPAIEAALEGKRFVSTSLQIGGDISQTPPRHEILFCSDSGLLSALADFVASALKSGNAALVRATKSHEDSLRAELRAHGVDVHAAIHRGTYAFVDVDQPPDPARVVDVIRRLGEAASNGGKQRPRVAYWGELAGRMWSEGRTDEAIRLEQLANELAKHHNVDILCPYPLPHGGEDHSGGLEKVCAEHSVVSFR